jgi:hypothetical protein
MKSTTTTSNDVDDVGNSDDNNANDNDGSSTHSFGQRTKLIYKMVD